MSIPFASAASRRRTSRVSAKGQITLPKPIRDELGVAPGGEVYFETLPSGEVVVRPRQPDAAPMAGLLSHLAPSEPVTTEQMDEDARREVARLDRLTLSGNYDAAPTQEER